VGGWESWTAKEASAWIVSLGQEFEQYGHLFKTNGIKGSELKDLDDETLKDLGVNKLFRKRILGQIGVLTSRKHSKHVSPSSAAAAAAAVPAEARKDDTAEAKLLAAAEQRFKELLLAKYGTPEVAFQAFDIKKKGAISRSDFKRALNSIGLDDISEKDRGTLRKRLDPNNTKKIELSGLVQFMAGSAKAEKEPNKTKRRHSQLHPLPLDVPVKVPTGLRHDYQSDLLFCMFC
jgi:hypothetical protein